MSQPADARRHRVIPIAAAAPDEAASPCESVEEAFALMVYGNSMQPEFAQGDVIIVEPEGEPHDGSYVVARVGNEWALRQLREHRGQWWLHALAGSEADVPLAAWSDLRGVVIQKRVAGRRRNSVSYV